MLPGSTPGAGVKRMPDTSKTDSESVVEHQYRVKLRRKEGSERYSYDGKVVSAKTSSLAEAKAESREWEAYDSSPLCSFCEPSPHGTNDADYHIYVNLAGPDEQKGMVWCCHMHFEALEEVLQA